eukprot:Clim_evm40s207 gene=Clim_evmTU40s207
MNDGSMTTTNPGDGVQNPRNNGVAGPRSPHTDMTDEERVEMALCYLESIKTLVTEYRDGLRLDQLPQLKSDAALEELRQMASKLRNLPRGDTPPTQDEPERRETGRTGGQERDSDPRPLTQHDENNRNQLRDDTETQLFMLPSGQILYLQRTRGNSASEEPSQQSGPTNQGQRQITYPGQTQDSEAPVPSSTAQREGEHENRETQQEQNPGPQPAGARNIFEALNQAIFGALRGHAAQQQGQQQGPQQHDPQQHDPQQQDPQQQQPESGPEQRGPTDEAVNRTGDETTTQPRAGTGRPTAAFRQFTFHPGGMTVQQGPQRIMFRGDPAQLFRMMPPLLFAGGFEDILRQLMTEGPQGNPPAAREQVEALPQRPYPPSGDNIRECHACSVCLEEYTTGGEVKIMPCGHFYHPGCIEQWLSLHNSCPTCRAELRPDHGSNVETMRQEAEQARDRMTPREERADLDFPTAPSTSDASNDNAGQSSSTGARLPTAPQPATSDGREPSPVPVPLEDSSEAGDDEDGSTGHGTTHTCQTCGAAARRRCSACRTVYYCSSRCQRQDWREHRTRCRPDHYTNTNVAKRPRNDPSSS